VSRNVLTVDVALAVGLAAIVLIVAPGVAVVAILALLVLAVCGASLLIDRRRGRRAPRRTRPPRRTTGPRR
jgi:uncharacterized protein (DUF58 family)